MSLYQTLNTESTTIDTDTMALIKYKQDMIFLAYIALHICQEANGDYVLKGSISLIYWLKCQMRCCTKLRAKDALPFRQQNSTLLYWWKELEVAPNFHAVCSILYTSKFSVNLMVQKLQVKLWWNWPQVGNSLSKLYDDT